MKIELKKLQSGNWQRAIKIVPKTALSDEYRAFANWFVLPSNWKLFRKICGGELGL